MAQGRQEVCWLGLVGWRSAERVATSKHAGMHAHTQQGNIFASSVLDGFSRLVKIPENNSMAVTKRANRVSMLMDRRTKPTLSPED